MHMRAFLCAEHRTLAPGKRRRQSLELKKHNFHKQQSEKKTAMSPSPFFVLLN